MDDQKKQLVTAQLNKLMDFLQFLSTSDREAVEKFAAFFQQKGYLSIREQQALTIIYEKVR